VPPIQFMIFGALLNLFTYLLKLTLNLKLNIDIVVLTVPNLIDSLPGLPGLVQKAALVPTHVIWWWY